VILIHQRGAGKSTPSASLEDNTTWHLIKDIEMLRVELGIDKWAVFGGSWGSTLSLTYSQTHPERVECLMLRGIFTLRRSELEFFYQNGASHIFPDAWEGYVAPIPVHERGDMITAYYKYLTGTDIAKRNECALAWSKWEMATSKLVVDPKYLERAEDPAWAAAFARIESHYFVNGGFFEDGFNLKKANIDKIRHIPTFIVQGRYDVVCPMTTAWDLHRAFPEAEFVVNQTSGHSAAEVDTTKALVGFANSWRDFIMQTRPTSVPPMVQGVVSTPTSEISPGTAAAFGKISLEPRDELVSATGRLRQFDSKESDLFNTRADSAGEHARSNGVGQAGSAYNNPQDTGSRLFCVDAGAGVDRQSPSRVSRPHTASNPTHSSQIIFG